MERRMQHINNRKFLKDERVFKEIERYRWIENIKCGFDIGFERAAEEWFKLHAAAWFKYHMPGFQSRRVKFGFQRARYLRQFRH